MSTVFDKKRAFLKGPDLFKRFTICELPIPLDQASLPDHTELLAFDFQENRYGLLVREMAYHHVAQGVVNDEPFMISFCGICHSGIGFSPLVDGKEHHFSAGGLPFGNVFGRFHGRLIESKGFLPPGFKLTMGKTDRRLPSMTQGLGVVVEERARFYPKEELTRRIEDGIGAYDLIVSVDPVDNVPYAETIGGDRPFQLFSRWYGFSYSFPGCEIFGDEKS